MTAGSALATSTAVSPGVGEKVKVVVRPAAAALPGASCGAFPTTTPPSARAEVAATTSAVVPATPSALTGHLASELDETPSREDPSPRRAAGVAVAWQAEAKVTAADPAVSMLTVADEAAKEQVVSAAESAATAAQHAAGARVTTAETLLPTEDEPARPPEENTDEQAGNLERGNPELESRNSGSSGVEL